MKNIHYNHRDDGASVSPLTTSLPTSSPSANPSTFPWNRPSPNQKFECYKKTETVSNLKENRTQSEGSHPKVNRVIWTSPDHISLGDKQPAALISAGIRLVDWTCVILREGSTF